TRFSRDWSSDVCSSDLKPNNYLVLAIISTVFCCLIPGIVSIVNAAKVNEAYALGNYEQAERASKNAKTWAIVGIAIACFFWLLRSEERRVGKGGRTRGG